MRRTADYVILGAGIAGMTLQHQLRASSVVLLDGAPGRYKIGESIIPQHFAEPEIRPLFEIASRLPSASPKDGTLFIDDRSIGGFELLYGIPTLHVARADLEAATAEFFGTEIVRERVESLDLDARTVVTDAGTWVANRLVIDCSGPARLVARALGLAREVWPVWASWAYHDVIGIDEDALFEVVRTGQKKFFRYSEHLRRADPDADWSGIRPSRCTTLTQVEDGVWTWQIPLFGATRLSVGVVSRHGPVDEEAYRALVGRSMAAQYRTRLREWDRSSPFNAFHVRNHFAWAADRFAGDGWALVGDAAFFGDPVYSVGTGFATDHAIQLGRHLRDHGWSAAAAEAHHRLTAELYGRARRAYDAWYFGEVVTHGETAGQIQDDFLRGRAFQVRTIHAYSEMWLVSHPQDAWHRVDPGRGEDVADRLAGLLEADRTLAGWTLASASSFGGRLELDWRRPDAPPVLVKLERAAEGRRYYRTAGPTGLWYQRPQNEPIGGQERALFDALVALEPRLGAELGNASGSASAPAATTATIADPGRGDERGRAVLRVGVVGGGTAGYLTALGLRSRHPSIDVTLLESSTIAVIGVGEATTPDLVEFLHRTLHIDEAALYRDVQPTWKLGIRFLWGAPGHTFHHPFTGDYLPEACAIARDQDLQSLGAQLMKSGLAPVLREPDGGITSLLSRVPYAYHLDNARFVAFLQRRAEAAGVRRVDCVVEEAEVGQDGAVRGLRTRDGRTLSFDLYVDATGFRSLLLGKALGVPFRSYDPSLRTDAAIAADVPNEGPIAPYTLAETMNAGWCWSIPQLDSDHRGYVFATSHLSADAAEAEMRAKNPGMGAARLVRFRSGRLERCWVGNVVGVGNAYAFVEPLESTALHMLVHQIRMLLDALDGPGDDAARARMNDAVGAHWDTLRGFLALHYRFNRRLDTPFWRDSERVDLASGEAMLAAFREGAPLVARPDRRALEDALFRTGFFGLLGVDNVLLGQQVPARMLQPSPSRAAVFERWARDVPGILARAMPQREALAAYRDRLGDVTAPVPRG